MGEGFGQRVRQARLDLSAKLGRVVTQTEVAELLGVTGTTVGRWEAGEKEPALETIVKLARVLEVSPAYLAFGHPARDAEDRAAELVERTRFDVTKTREVETPSQARAAARKRRGA